MNASVLQRCVIAAIFVAGGAAHFAWPGMYEKIVPPYLGDKRRLVEVSGAFEILGGVGARVPGTRRAAGWGLIALLIAVFPANVYMATDAARFAAIPRWALYARLPLQLLLIRWVFETLVRRPE
jgi:uncharacterized membrane protein